jgi:protein-arginine kinase activator protein McsA
MHAICEACGIRPATRFLCQIADGQQTKHEFCSECFVTDEAAAGVQLPTIEGHSCYYCGGPAQSAAPNMEWERRARDQFTHYTCSRCGLIFSEILLASLAALQDPLPPHLGVDALAELTSEIDKRVRERVGDQKT